MIIDRILYPITSLGPGRRITVWTCGCSKHCDRCANPELWEFDRTKDVDVQKLVDIVKKICSDYSVDGLTLTGGDPLEQFDDVISLCKGVRNDINDILIYTGYTFAQLADIRSEEDISNLRKYSDVIVDGPYIDALNEKNMALRGSSNQNIIYFCKDNSRYKEYISNGRTIQNVFYDKGIISVGIHNHDEEE